VSLREEWYAARQQREQQVRERQQQVLEHRQQIQAEMAALHQHQRTMLSQYYQNLATDTAEFLSTTSANRAAMAAAQRESLSNFHSTLQAEVAAFREETRSQQQQAWFEQAHERAAYVAAVRDYVWGTTPTPGNASFATGVSPSQPRTATQADVSGNLERVFQYLQQNSGARLSQIETALGLSQLDTVNALQTLINHRWVVQQDQGYLVTPGSQL
jgi:gas vesicle GvpC-like protein